MSYVPRLAARAEASLARLPPVVASFVLDEIDRLAADPVGLSRPSHFPYPPDRQLFPTRYEHEGVIYVFSVLFRYGQDEQTLYILQIAVHTIGSPDD